MWSYQQQQQHQHQYSQWQPEQRYTQESIQRCAWCGINIMADRDDENGRYYGKTSWQSLGEFIRCDNSEDCMGRCIRQKRSGFFIQQKHQHNKDQRMRELYNTIPSKM